MPTPPKNHVNLYETKEDIETSVPYATISADELSLAINRFNSWAIKLATYPDLAGKFGETKAKHIQIATDLRNAVKHSRYHRSYRCAVLPMNEYFAAMAFLAASRSIQPEIDAMIERENQRWEAGYQI
jgi:hypothetical protein